jgi:hypothetical protein
MRISHVIPYKWFLSDVITKPNILLAVWIFEPPSIASIAEIKDASSQFPLFFRFFCCLPIWVVGLCALGLLWIWVARSFVLAFGISPTWIASSCALAATQIDVGPCALVVMQIGVRPCVLVDYLTFLGLLDWLNICWVDLNACTFSLCSWLPSPLPWVHHNWLSMIGVGVLTWNCNVSPQHVNKLVCNALGSALWMFNL